MREIRREIRNGDRVVDAKLVGCTPEYQALNLLQLDRGRFLTDRDLAGTDNVAVLAHKTAEILFPYEDPIGRTVQIGTDFYLVVGQTAQRTPSAAIGGSLEAREYDLDVYIPLSTLRARIGDMVLTARSGSREGEVVQLSQITVTVEDLAEVDATADVIRALLEKYHKTPDFAVVVPKELLRQAEMMRTLFNVLLVLIAGISLLVGGIGIMNIMLASVTERTREIGIRRAIGAKRRQIVYQFLIETVVLSTMGGIIGLGVGALIPFLITYFSGMVTLMTWKGILVPLLISMTIGILFGLYPAVHAAQVDPIVALRHE